MNSKNRGACFILLAVTLMSTGGLLIKSIEASAISIAFGRSLIAGCIFLPFIKWRKIKFSKNYIGLIISYTYLTISFVIATKLTTAANAIILQCTAPLWLYLAYLIGGKKKLVAREFIPRVTILAGIIIIFCDPLNASGNATAMAGNILALSAGIAYALEQYFMEKKHPMDDITIIGFINFIMAGVMLVFMHSQISFSGIPAINWLYLILLGVFQIGISYLFFLKGVRLVSAFEASILSLLEPMLNPVFVFLFVGEVPSTYTICGFAAILCGIILTLIPNKKATAVALGMEEVTETQEQKKKLLE
ncbi:DMT family transporter [Eubacterium limosum]|uniref:DMT family transporter n=1 Tax=Eubacterium limosum TaxID=1736 RepID=UPI003721C6F3